METNSFKIIWEKAFACLLQLPEEQQVVLLVHNEAPGALELEVLYVPPADEDAVAVGAVDASA